MSMLIRLAKYTWRAWPAIIIVALLFSHVLLVRYLSAQASTIHKTISFSSQLIGGLMILYSIDSNIGIIKHKNLVQMLVEYLKEFPLIKRHVVLEVQGAVMAVSGGKAKLTVTRNPTTVEEKLKYLKEQIDDVRREVEAEVKDLNHKIDSKSEAIERRLHETQAAMKVIENKMEDVSICGIKVQLFGVLLMVYGTVASYIA